MFEERHLNFNKFLDDRAEQISKFRDILKLDTKKKGHQALPKSVRRRAMSHNRYRIPSKMRKLNEEQLIKSENMQRIPKCRKHIRKISRLILSYKERHSKIKWLSTHLWAAKRMRMIDYYGYKVAQTPNQKAFRSSYRNFMHNCCMIDLSYFQCLTILFNEKSSQIPKNIKIFSQKFGKIQKLVYLNELDCNQSYEGSLLNKNGGLICPLIIFFSFQDQNSVKTPIIRCYFNPCCLDEVKNQFVGQFSFTVSIDRCKSQFYCLMGPQWANKINQALTTYGLESKIQDFQRLKFNPMQSKILFTQGQNQNKSQKCPFISDPIPSLIKQTCQNSSTALKIRNQTQKLFKLLSNKKQEKQNQIDSQNASKFWSFYDNIKSYSDMVNIKITTRSKYTHKRRNKLTKDQKKKVINLENKKKELISSKQVISQEQQDSASHQMIEESLENIKNEIKEFFIEQKQSKGLNQQIVQGQNGKVQKVDPVLVTSFKKQSLFQGCYIFCSDQDSCRLWRILSKLNVKVIGIQQLKHIRLESQVLSFPQNYPETLSFQRHSERQAEKQFLRLKRRPPSKRTNFIKINSRNPFSLVEKQFVNNHIKVFLQMVSKGRCFSNSYVYQLSMNDITFIENEMNEKGKVGIIQSETTKNQMTGGSRLKPKQFINYLKQNVISVEQKLSQLKEKRNLIGRVMTGGFIYSKSYEGGIAYVSKSMGVQKQNLKNDGYVLVRKVSSPHYYLAQITKIYPQLSLQ